MQLRKQWHGLAVIGMHRTDKCLQLGKGTGQEVGLAVGQEVDQVIGQEVGQENGQRVAAGR